MLMMAKMFALLGGKPDTIRAAWANISTTVGVPATNSASNIVYARGGPTRSIRVAWDGWKVIDQLLEYKINSGSFVTIPSNNTVISGLANGDSVQFRFTETAGVYDARTITVTDVLTGIVIDTFTVDSA